MLVEAELSELIGGICVSSLSRLPSTAIYLFVLLGVRLGIPLTQTTDIDQHSLLDFREWTVCTT